MRSVRYVPGAIVSCQILYFEIRGEAMRLHERVVDDERARRRAAARVRVERDRLAEARRVDDHDAHRLHHAVVAGERFAFAQIRQRQLADRNLERRRIGEERVFGEEFRHRIHAARVRRAAGEQRRGSRPIDRAARRRAARHRDVERIARHFAQLQDAVDDRRPAAGCD